MLYEAFLRDGVPQAGSFLFGHTLFPFPGIHALGSHEAVRFLDGELLLFRMISAGGAAQRHGGQQQEGRRQQGDQFCGDVFHVVFLSF